MNWKRKVYYALSPEMRRTVRRIYYWPIDLWEGITGQRDSMTPPKGKIFIGPGNFKALGEKLRSDFIQYGNLKPKDRVLDIGSGIGRIAIPLTGFIKTPGSYEGFDIVKEGVDWCKERISSKFPNFNFTHVQLKNDLYNLEAGKEASEFVFPYGDNEFDFVILTSVFTHMQQKDVAGYINEIGRVMKKGGTCFATFFILDAQSLEFLSKSKDPFFKFDHGDYFLHDDKVKDANIAYKIEVIEAMAKDGGLTIAKHHKGWWCGGSKTENVDFQDVLILRKP